MLNFTINISETSWNIDLGGWICPILKIPTSKIDAVYSEGDELNKENYKILYDHNVIKWISPKERPKSFTASVTIEKDLSTKEITLKWKKIAILMSLLFSIMSVLAGIYLHNKPINNHVKPQVKITYPLNNDRITDGRTKVSGIAKKISNQRKLWLVVYQVGRLKYYPQQEVIVENDGEWEGQVILSSANDDYYIWAIITDESQGKWFEEISNFKKLKFTPEFSDKIKVSRPDLIP